MGKQTHSFGEEKKQEEKLSPAELADLQIIKDCIEGNPSKRKPQKLSRKHQ